MSISLGFGLGLTHTKGTGATPLVEYLVLAGAGGGASRGGAGGGGAGGLKQGSTGVRYNRVPVAYQGPYGTAARPVVIP